MQMFLDLVIIKVIYWELVSVIPAQTLVLNKSSMFYKNSDNTANNLNMNINQ